MSTTSRDLHSTRQGQWRLILRQASIDFSCWGWAVKLQKWLWIAKRQPTLQWHVAEQVMAEKCSKIFEINCSFKTLTPIKAASSVGLCFLTIRCRLEEGLRNLKKFTSSIHVCESVKNEGFQLLVSLIWPWMKYKRISTYSVLKLCENWRFMK